MKSAFLKLNLKDLWKGVLLVVLTTIVGGLYNILDLGTLPDIMALKQIGATALTAGAAYLLKQLITNSNDQLLKLDDKK